MNIFAVFHHAHLLGRGLVTRHYRNGTELKPIAEDRNYDFDYQDTRLLKDEVNLRAVSSRHSVHGVNCNKTQISFYFKSCVMMVRHSAHRSLFMRVIKYALQKIRSTFNFQDTEYTICKTKLASDTL